MSHDFQQRNEQFAVSGAHQGLPGAPSTGLVVVACVDHRADPAHTMGLELGEALVIRTVGGRVTDAVIDQLVMLRHLFGDALEEVMVVHHTSCGAQRFAGEEMAAALRHDGIAAGTVAAVAIVDPVEALRSDVARLASPPVGDGMAVTGHVYDLTTGELRRMFPTG